MCLTTSRTATKLAVLILLLSSFQSLVSCKTRTQSLAGLTNTQEAAEARMTKAKDSVVPVLRSFMDLSPADPSRVLLEQYFVNREELDTLDQLPDFEKNVGIANVRPGVVALSKSELGREVLLNSVIAEQRRRSQVLSQRLYEESSSGFSNLTFDTIIIGAGPHGATMAQTFTDRQPSRKVLIIDAASRPGGTFAEVDNVFALNSTNRRETGDKAIVGKAKSGGATGQGNLNAVADVIGIPDFTGVQWPVAGSLGYVTTLAAELSSAELLLGHKVFAIGGTPSSATVQIEGPRGKIGLRAAQVIVATGIGKPKFFLSESKNPEDRSLLSKARNAFLSATQQNPNLIQTKAPIIQTFGEFARRAASLKDQGLNPMGPYIGKDILVVGSGDSGKVVIEWLSGLGPDNSYIEAQAGAPERIIWAGPTFRSCKEYLDQSRSRYSRISRALNGAIVKIAPGRVTSMSQSGGRIRVNQFDLRKPSTKDQDFLSPDTLNLLNNPPAAGALYTTTNLFDQKTKSGQVDAQGRVVLQVNAIERDFDYVIDTTGFESGLLELLQADQGFGKAAYPNGTELGSIFEPLIGNIEAFENQGLSPDRIYARQLVSLDQGTRLPIYTAGPANEDIGPLPDPNDETADISANTVSLFANIERSKKLASQLASERSEFRASFDRRDGLTGATGLGLTRNAGVAVLTAPFSNSLPVADSNGNAIQELTLVLNKGVGLETYNTPFLPELELEVWLRKIFGNIDASGLDPSGQTGKSEFQLYIRLDQSGRPATTSEKKIAINFIPPLQDANFLLNLSDYLKKNPQFRSFLFDLFPPDRLSPLAESGSETFVASSKTIYQVTFPADSGTFEDGYIEVVAIDPKRFQTRTRIVQDIDTRAPQTTAGSLPSNALLDSWFQSKRICLLFESRSSSGYTPVTAIKPFLTQDKTNGRPVYLATFPVREGQSALIFGDIGKPAPSTVTSLDPNDFLPAVGLSPVSLMFGVRENIDSTLYAEFSTLIARGSRGEPAIIRNNQSEKPFVKDGEDVSDLSLELIPIDQDRASFRVRQSTESGVIELSTTASCIEG